MESGLSRSLAANWADELDASGMAATGRVVEARHTEAGGERSGDGHVYTTRRWHYKSFQLTLALPVSLSSLLRLVMVW